MHTHQRYWELRQFDWSNSLFVVIYSIRHRCIRTITPLTFIPVSVIHPFIHLFIHSTRFLPTITHILFQTCFSHSIIHSTRLSSSKAVCRWWTRQHTRLRISVCMGLHCSQHSTCPPSILPCLLCSTTWVQGTVCRQSPQVCVHARV